MKVDAFVLQRSLKTLDHAVVDPALLAIHTDFDLRVRQYVDPAATGTLAALIGVEYLWRAVFCQRIFQGLNAELRVHAVGQPPGQDLATVPVHDCQEIQEVTPHRDIGDICAPDLVRPIDHHIPQQIGPDLLLPVLLAGVGFLIDRHQPHEAHQSPDTITTAFVIVQLHLPSHLS